MFIKYTFIIGDHCTNTAISTIQIVQKNYGVWEGSLKKYFVFWQIAHIYEVPSIKNANLSIKYE